MHDSLSGKKAAALAIGCCGCAFQFYLMLLWLMRSEADTTSVFL
jgi:hypothetical protein